MQTNNPKQKLEKRLAEVKDSVPKIRKSYRNNAYTVTEYLIKKENHPIALRYGKNSNRIGFTDHYLWIGIKFNEKAFEDPVYAHGLVYGFNSLYNLRTGENNFIIGDNDYERPKIINIAARNSKIRIKLNMPYKNFNFSCDQNDKKLISIIKEFIDILKNSK